MNSQNTFLPMDRAGMEARGWPCVDVLFITGDAYVDHPSFGAALLCRLMESKGWRAGIIAQPRWDRPDDFLVMGKPRLCCMVSSGNIDSMVAHYTSGLKVRNDDPYSPGGTAGRRPDRAVITYCSRVRQAFGSIPLIIGGLEASLRRFAHYDYWSDKVRRSILLDAKADLLVYGMGELQTLQIMSRLDSGEPISQLTDIPGTTVSISLAQSTHYLENQSVPITVLPSYGEVCERDPKSNTPTPQGLMAYASAFQKQMLHENPMVPQILAQPSNDRFVIQNPPARPLTQPEFDALYELPFTRGWHPVYDPQGGVPALAEVQFSITSNRGCFGSCSFCAITSHQGRMVITRSIDSLVKEAKELVKHPDFKGYIHDVGGPTANFQGPACTRQASKGPCPTRMCLFPEPCSHLIDHHGEYLEKLAAIRAVAGVKKVFIRSGIRYDYLLRTGTPASRQTFLDQLVRNHVSGQLKIAPEHIAPPALAAMGKPKVELYEDFLDQFAQANDRAGLRQYCIPYFIAAHPGCTLESSIELALYLKREKFIPDQVQEFYPTPGTVSTCMYYTGMDPRPGMGFSPIHIPKGREKHLQRALLHYHKEENRLLVKEALITAGRQDLIAVLLPSDRRPLPKRRLFGASRS
ncbi:MAG: YgiQ family radical SAM protein [Sphaerochaetaceae bacterium]